MNNINSILGIIPVRGGSKRLPGKNMRVFQGMTLLEWTIRQAKKACPVSVVSTDNEKMILEALRCGVKALFRPNRLANDTATSAEVVEHVIFTYPHFHWFCLLQVTSPLRTLYDIQNCIEIAGNTNKPVVSTFKDEPNGAIYIGKTMKFAGDFFTGAQKYEMPEDRSIDINTMSDFEKAEELANAQENSKQYYFHNN